MKLTFFALLFLACASKPAQVANASACEEKGKAISQDRTLTCEQKRDRLREFVQREQTCQGLYGPEGPLLHCKGDP